MAEEANCLQTTVLVYVGKTGNNIAYMHVRTMLTLTGAMQNTSLSMGGQYGNHKQ
jgi:hypothetical protein